MAVARKNRRRKKLASRSAGIALALAAAALLTACGGSAVEEPPANATGGSTGGGTVTPSVPEIPFTPGFTFDFVLCGDDDCDDPNDSTATDETKYTSPGVATDSIFKVRITAGPAADVPGVDEVEMSYGCAQYKVTVGGDTVWTNILAVPGEDHQYCPDAAESQVIDFSDRTGGADPLTVKISNPRYDFYCGLWWEAYYSAPWGYNPNEWATYNAGIYSSVCPLRTLHHTHSVSGTIEVEVNGS